VPAVLNVAQTQPNRPRPDLARCADTAYTLWDASLHVVIMRLKQLLEIEDPQRFACELARLETLRVWARAERGLRRRTASRALGGGWAGAVRDAKAYTALLEELRLHEDELADYTDRALAGLVTEARNLDLTYGLPMRARRTTRGVLTALQAERQNLGKIRSLVLRGS
jgi:hypothetical protein